MHRGKDQNRYKNELQCNVLCSIHISYLGKFVEAQNVGHVHAYVRSPNGCYWIYLKAALVVWDRSSLRREKLHRSKVGPAHAEVAVVDVEAQGDVG